MTYRRYKYRPPDRPTKDQVQAAIDLYNIQPEDDMISMTIIGNLGGEPELKFMPDGTPITNFSMASNDGSGDKKTTTWYRVAVWGKQAEPCNQYLHKGSLVAVTTSRLKASTYQSKAGSQEVSLEVTADRVRFLDSKKDDEPAFA